MITKQLNLKTYVDQNLQGYFEVPGDAEIYLQQLKKSLNNIDDRKKRVQTLGNIGVTLLHLRRLDQAQHYLELSLSEIDLYQMGDRLRVQQMIRLGNLFQWRADFNRGDHLYQKAIAIAKRVDEARDYLDFGYQHYGKSLFDQKRYREALELFQQALAIREKRSNEGLIESTQLAIETVLNYL